MTIWHDAEYEAFKRGRALDEKPTRHIEDGWPDCDCGSPSLHYDDCAYAKEVNASYGSAIRAMSRERRFFGGFVGNAKTDSPNPKDLIGETKVPNLSVIPSTAIVHLGRAMANGSVKYGAFNWRQHPVRSSIYADACMRHLMAWVDGEEEAEDSGVHHLGHAMACLGILLDAQESGNLIDERVSGPAAELLERFKRSGG